MGNDSHFVGLAALQKEFWAVDRELPVSGFRTMEQILDTETLQRRMQMSWLGTFAGLALLLAAVGTYGVMSYLVTRRTGEIGIRMALGAGRGNVTWMVLQEGLRLAAVGIATGLAASFAATRMLGALLYGVKPNDPATLAAVSVTMAAVALAACLVPAVRALRIEPVIALRYE